ncbi:hypothetical protein M3204_07335 [Mesobacillus subterraneus]|jgi:hypothetical protein|uniref:hypothetical protein n=1 Tax=Mesobacillus subterraneus TaxID=285983 RepID=UPI00203EB22C|nr:hypothetical protein [Mesobacillus subterraneus]MCM3664211.1 hypothetical protein [Mesobacillus subterraneus]MCM3682239.1 hypothetical protein [Mesobacillus subterraneus]
MIRMSIAGVAGFVLVFIESYFVMVIKQYETIEFGGIAPFVSVWTMNFFLVFSILTHIKFWHDEREAEREEEAAERDRFIN